MLTSQNFISPYKMNFFLLTGPVAIFRLLFQFIIDNSSESLSLELSQGGAIDPLKVIRNFLNFCNFLQFLCTGHTLLSVFWIKFKVSWWSKCRSDYNIIYLHNLIQEKRSLEKLLYLYWRIKSENRHSLGPVSVNQFYTNMCWAMKNKQKIRSS